MTNGTRPTQEQIQVAARDLLAPLLGIEAEDIDLSRDLPDCGLNSILAVQLASGLREKLGIEVPSGLVLRSRTVGELSWALAAQAPPAA